MKSGRPLLSSGWSVFGAFAVPPIRALIASSRRPRPYAPCFRLKQVMRLNVTNTRHKGKRRRFWESRASHFDRSHLNTRVNSFAEVHMAEKALTEMAKQDVSREKHLWPSIGRLVRENQEEARRGSKPASPTGFQMGRTQNEAGVVWTTAIFMAIFHLGAIAALFFFSLDQPDCSGSALYSRCRLRYRHGLSSPSGAPRLPGAKGRRILSDSLRHFGPGRRPNRLGGDASYPSSAQRPPWRSAHST